MEIKHDAHKTKGVFFIEEDGERLAELEYFESAPGEITVYHTGVNEKLRGRHIGEKLVATVVTFAREKGVKIVPQCPFTKKVIDRTPEYQGVLAS